LQQQFGGQATDVCHFPTDRIAHRHICPEPERLPAEAFHLPPRAIVDQLLDAYFRHVNPGFPVVDQDIVMAQYNQRDPLNPPSLLLLHAMLVAGAHALYDQPRRETMKALFFRRAKSLFDARFERNRDTIVQAALLLTWHADGLEDVSANAWFWLGVAVRTATGLGMHRDAENSTLVPNNKRMWRRVWWLLFACDTLVSLQYGRPQSIRLDESDVQKLRVSDFQDCGPHSDPDFAIQMTELCIIISAALRDRFRIDSSPESRALTLLATDEALAHWSLNLPESLQLHDVTKAGTHSAILHMHYNTALILLHRTPPGESLQPSDGALHHDNSGICIAAAGAIQSVFQRLCEDEELRRLWISSINCLFTALIQLSVEVRYLNPVLAVSALRRYDSAITSLKCLAEYWPNAQSILHFFASSVRQPWRVDRPVRGSPPRLPGPRNASEDGKHTSPAGEGLARSQTTVSSSGEVTSAGRQRSQPPPCRIPPIQLPPSPINSWQDFQNAFWQSPEFTDDVLFTF
jgi:transcriptional regulatory protein AMDR